MRTIALVVAFLLAQTKDGGTKGVSDGGINVPWIDSSTVTISSYSVMWGADGGMQINACGMALLRSVDGGTVPFALPACVSYSAVKLDTQACIQSLIVANGL